MSRRVYTDRDKALVALALQVNEGNIRRTARETGVPINTVRDWKRLFEKDGYPQAVELELEEATGDFLDKAEGVRWKMIQAMDQKVDAASMRDLITGVGVLTDKINVIKGLATSRTEVVQAQLPDAKELARELARFVEQTVESTQRRHEVIEEADWAPVQPLQIESNP